MTGEEWHALVVVNGVDGITVGHDVAVEAPAVAQDRAEEEIVGARGHPVDLPPDIDGPQFSTKACATLLGAQTSTEL